MKPLESRNSSPKYPTEGAVPVTEILGTKPIKSYVCSHGDWGEATTKKGYFVDIVVRWGNS